MMKTIQDNVKAGRRQHYYDNSNEIRHDKATIRVWWRLYRIMLRRDAANNNSATTNIPQRLRDNVQAGCRQQLSSKAGRRQLIRADKAGCRQQLYFKAGGRQRSWCEYVPFFSKQQWNCHTVASLENSRLYIYIYIYIYIYWHVETCTSRQHDETARQAFTTGGEQPTHSTRLIAKRSIIYSH